MDGYGQYCPIALGAEIFAERWTPIILRNLMVGCDRFGDLLDGRAGPPAQRAGPAAAHASSGTGVVARSDGRGPPTG